MQLIWNKQEACRRRAGGSFIYIYFFFKFNFRGGGGGRGGAGGTPLNPPLKGNPCKLLCVSVNMLFYYCSFILVYIKLNQEENHVDLLITGTVMRIRVLQDLASLNKSQ